MACFFGLLALAAPRVTIALLVVLGDYVGRGFETNWIPFLGFLFMPLTVLAYAFARNQHGAVEGWWIAVVIAAAAIDLGLAGGGAKRTRAGG